MSHTYLRVKIKSLASEAGHIRLEERRAKRSLRWARANQKTEIANTSAAAAHDLYMHRVRVVRPAAREALLAYALLQERACPEAQGSSKPDLAAVAKNLRAFGWDPMCDADGQYDIIRAWIKQTSLPKTPPRQPTPEQRVLHEAARLDGLKMKAQVARSRNAG